ncbi:MAG TPA: hypothetical protein PKI00_02800 [Candidatus Pacearchaeota archaeon]|nr:hypothetical protein [Candidatus Pacearchaeota archaeon]
MNKYNKKLFYLLLIFLFGTIFLSPQNAIACSPRTPFITIKAQKTKNILSQQKNCLDQNCLITLEKNESGSFSLWTEDSKYITDIDIDKDEKTINIYYFSLDSFKENDLYKNAFLEVLDQLIEDDITDIKSIFFQEVESWINNWKGYFLSGDLIFSSYGQNKETKILKNKGNLLNCNYVEYKRVGNWLVESDASRDYCYLSSGFGCPVPVISYTKFFNFLVSNINNTTIFYLTIFLAIIISTVSFIIYLIIKKELGFFLKPRKRKIIVTIFAVVIIRLYLLLGFFSIETYLWQHFLLAYFVLSLFEYIVAKRKSLSKAN